MKNYNRKKSFENILTGIVLCGGLTLFSYTGYMAYKCNIKPKLSSNTGKNIEKIVNGNYETNQKQHQTYSVSSEYK